MADYKDTIHQLYTAAEAEFRAEHMDYYNEVFHNTEGKNGNQIAADVASYEYRVYQSQMDKLYDANSVFKSDSLAGQLTTVESKMQDYAKDLECIDNGGGGKQHWFTKDEDKFGEHLNGTDGLYAQLERVKGTEAEAVIQERIDKLEATKAEIQAEYDAVKETHTQLATEFDNNKKKYEFWEKMSAGDTNWLEQNADKIAAISTTSIGATGAGVAEISESSTSTAKGTPLPKDPNNPYYTQHQYTAGFGNEPKAGAVDLTGSATRTYVDTFSISEKVCRVLREIAGESETHRNTINANLERFREASAISEGMEHLQNRRTQLIQQIQIQRGGQGALDRACTVLADFIGIDSASGSNTLFGILAGVDDSVASCFNECMSNLSVAAEGATGDSTATLGSGSIGSEGNGSNGSTGVPSGSTSVPTGGAAVGGSVPTSDRKVMTNSSEILDFQQDGMTVKNGVITGGALDGQYYKGKFYRDGSIYEADGAGNEKLLGSYDSMKNDVTISSPKGGIVDTPIGYKAGGTAATTAATTAAINDMNKLADEADALFADDVATEATTVKKPTTGGATGGRTSSEILDDVSEITDDGRVIHTDDKGNIYATDKNGDITELFEEDELLEDVQEFTGGEMETSEVRGNEVFSNDPNGANTFNMNNPFGAGETFSGGSVDTSNVGVQPNPMFNPFANMQGTQPLSFNSTVLFPEGSGGADWGGISPFTNFDVNNISESAASALNDVGIHVIGDGVLSGAGTENLVASSAELGFLSKEQVTWAANVLHQIPGAQFGNVEATTYSMEKGAFIYPINPPADFITALYRF